MNIGEQIKQALKNQGYTQRWLANEITLDEKTLSGKLNRDSITAQELLQIGELLNMNLNKMKKGDTTMNNLEKVNAQALAEKMSQLEYGESFRLFYKLDDGHDDSYLEFKVKRIEADEADEIESDMYFIMAIGGGSQNNIIDCTFGSEEARESNIVGWIMGQLEDIWEEEFEGNSMFVYK